VAAEVISLCDYRKSRQEEKRLKSVKSKGFPDDLDFGPDDPTEDWLGLFNYPMPLTGINVQLTDITGPDTSGDDPL
jgi:hypothetical protein